MTKVPIEGNEPTYKPKKKLNVKGLLSLTLIQFCVARQFREDHIGGFEAHCRENNIIGNRNVHEWNEVFKKYQNTPVR